MHEPLLGTSLIGGTDSPAQTRARSRGCGGGKGRAPGGLLGAMEIWTALLSARLAAVPSSHSFAVGAHPAPRAPQQRPKALRHFY